MGLIVGPSGAGKSTMARHVWPDEMGSDLDWDGRAIVDNFPDGHDYQVRHCSTVFGRAFIPTGLAAATPYSVGR